MDLNNKYQPVLKSLGERLMKNALTWGTTLINLNISRKRQPGTLSSRCGTIISRKHHPQSMLKKKSELESDQASISKDGEYLNKREMFNDSTRVKVAIGQIPIM